jgi:hypothetical protein
MTEKRFDLGNSVICDWCGDDYTHRDDVGGFLFERKAVCPACAPQMEEDARADGEDQYITARCPERMSFRAWVINVLREGQPAYIKITSGDDVLTALLRRAAPKGGFTT